MLIPLAFYSTSLAPENLDSSIDRLRSRTAQRREGSRQIARFVIYCVPVTLALLKGLAPMDKAMVEALESKHSALHALIDAEEHRPHPDEDLLHRLKKEKLRLKDELAGHFAH
ncbi:MAG TPA: YdcH family protein [Sphingomicrobium sp.]|nr:YdcH family protein [Sphingomicrobium sp.]